jgi:hypothetical protein
MQTSAARVIAVHMVHASTMHANVTTRGPALIVQWKSSAQTPALGVALATMELVLAISVMVVQTAELSTLRPLPVAPFVLATALGMVRVQQTTALAFAMSATMEPIVRTCGCGSLQLWYRVRAIAQAMALVSMERCAHVMLAGLLTTVL